MRNCKGDWDRAIVASRLWFELTTSTLAAQEFTMAMKRLSFIRSVTAHAEKQVKNYLCAGLLLLSFLAGPVIARGQSACAQLGVNCTHPTTPQRPPGDNNKRGGSVYEPQLSNKDQAWNLTAEGGTAAWHYSQSGSLSDYQASYNLLMQALAKQPNYGAAEFQLCRLYWYAKKWSDALTACNASIQHGAGGKEYPQIKVKFVKSEIPYLQLMHHRQEHDTAVAKYSAACGSGGVATQFSSAFGITTGESEQGLPVDLSASVMQTVASCQQQAAALAVDAQAIDHEYAAYQKTEKE